MSELIEKSIFGRFVIWYTDNGVYTFSRIGRWFFCKMGDPVYSPSTGKCCYCGLDHSGDEV